MPRPPQAISSPVSSPVNDRIFDDYGLLQVEIRKAVRHDAEKKQDKVSADIRKDIDKWTTEHRETMMRQAEEMEDLYSALTKSLAERNKTINQLRKKYHKAEKEIKSVLERSGQDEKERNEATRSGEALVKVIKKNTADRGTCIGQVRTVLGIKQAKRQPRKTDETLVPSDIDDGDSEEDDRGELEGKSKALKQGEEAQSSQDDSEDGDGDSDEEEMGGR